MKKFLMVLFLLLLTLAPGIAFARVSVNDMYQAKRQAWEETVAKLSPQNQTRIKKADQLLKDVNLKVCLRFDEDIAKLTAVDLEIRRRKGLDDLPTVVAYGQGKNQLENAEYWLNYAQEAVAYQKVADYTTTVGGDSSVDAAIKAEVASLRSDLGVLIGKINHAKVELQKVLDEK